MFKRIVVLAAVCFMASLGSARAQETRAELSAFAGWTFSDGVSGTSVRAPDGNTYDRVDPKDSASWGFSFGILAGPNAEVGFIYGQQPSKLVLGGTADRELGDMSVKNYHGYFGYNFGEADAKVRPYFLFGLGATNYGGVDFTRSNGQPGTIASFTQFSTTWGAGVKGYGAGHVGYRAGASWTPTYIKSDSVGWWCDPYWGCYVVGDPQYANQFSLNGGVLFKF